MATNLDTHGEAGTRPANTSWEEAMSAATREAAAEFGSMTGEETEVADDADTGEDDASEGYESADDTAAETEETDSDEAEVSEDDKGEPEPLGMKWDGNPETIPAEWKPGWDRAMAMVSKGVNKRLREIAEKEKQLDAVILQYRQATAPQAPQQAAADNDPMPQKPAESASDEVWESYYDARAEWKARQVLKQEIAAGRIVTADKHHEVADHMARQERLGLIARQDGCTDAVMYRMAQMAEANPVLAGMLESDDGSLALFQLARRDVEMEQAVGATQAQQAEAAKKAAEEAKRKAGAGKAALPRPGGATKASPVDEVFQAKKDRMDASERLAYLNRQAAKEMAR